ncbi:hypothetical protein [Proteus penneri]|uniref:tail fiber/spike domain-containing protein n=1 Tax=Proteus penneri TaxID=102862 RepID=UPI001EFB65B0|nr:hypothetical protein [Proteus penneri]
MTVSTELSHEEYVGNGVTTDFDFRFRIFESKHLIVVVADSDGNETTLKNGTDYTIVGAGSYHGGKVVLNKPLAQGWKILLERDLPVVQETDLRNQGKFFAEVHEDAFDYLTMLIQKALGTFSLSLRKPTYLSNYYDAKGNRIANLASPKVGTDAANKDYVDNSIKYIDSKTLRVNDKDIPALPSAEQRRNKQLGFDNEGYPQLLDPAETGSLGYVLVDSFEKGAEITTRYQALHWESNGEYYRWDGDLPKYVPSNSNPEDSGGIGLGKWVSIGDSSIRNDLGIIIKRFNTFLLVKTEKHQVGDIFETLGYYNLFDNGACRYEVVGFLNKNEISIHLYDDLYAKPIIKDNSVYLEQLGGKADNFFDNWSIYYNIYKYNLKIEHPLKINFNGDYFFSKPIILCDYMSFDGGQARSTLWFDTEGRLPKEDIFTKSITAYKNEIFDYTKINAQLFFINKNEGEYCRGVNLLNISTRYTDNIHTNDNYGDYCLYSKYLTGSELNNCKFSDGKIIHFSNNMYINKFTNVYYYGHYETRWDIGSCGVYCMEPEVGFGGGTTNTWINCGSARCYTGFKITGMNYSNLISCYSEGSTKICIDFNRCNINIRSFGVENVNNENGGMFRFRESNSIVDLIDFAYKNSILSDSLIYCIDNSNVVIGSIVSKSLLIGDEVGVAWVQLGSSLTINNSDNFLNKFKKIGDILSGNIYIDKTFNKKVDVLINGVNSGKTLDVYYKYMGDRFNVKLSGILDISGSGEVTLSPININWSGVLYSFIQGSSIPSCVSFSRNSIKLINGYTGDPWVYNEKQKRIECSGFI